MAHTYFQFVLGNQFIIQVSFVKEIFLPSSNHVPIYKLRGARVISIIYIHEINQIKQKQFRTIIFLYPSIQLF